MRESYGGSDCRLAVLDVSVGIKISTRQAVVYVWTLRGQTTLSVAYNEAFHTGGQMREFLRDVKKDVFKNLGA